MKKLQLLVVAVLCTMALGVSVVSTTAQTPTETEAPLVLSLEQVLTEDLTPNQMEWVYEMVQYEFGEICSLNEGTQDILSGSPEILSVEQVLELTLPSYKMKQVRQFVKEEASRKCEATRPATK